VDFRPVCAIAVYSFRHWCPPLPEVRPAAGAVTQPQAVLLRAGLTFERDRKAINESQVYLNITSVREPLQTMSYIADGSKKYKKSFVISKKCKENKLLQ